LVRSSLRRSNRLGWRASFRRWKRWRMSDRNWIAAGACGWSALAIKLIALGDRRSAECVILWSGGATTKHRVELPPIGWHCVTEPEVVGRIRLLAPTMPDHQIAAQLSAEGLRTKTDKEWTYQRVVSLRKTYQIPTGCPLNTSGAHAPADGMVSAKAAAQMLRISPSLVQFWITRGVLVCDQRVAASRLWVRMTAADLERLDGSFDSRRLPTINEVMKHDGLTREEVW